MKKRKKPVSMTAKSMKWLRDHGYQVANVEKWIPGADIRKDVYGFGDLLACGFVMLEPVIALIQVTSHTNRLARINKILSLPEAIKWLNCRGRIWVHSWRCYRHRGMPRPTWQLTESVIDLSSFQKEVTDGEVEVEVKGSRQQAPNR